MNLFPPDESRLRELILHVAAAFDGDSPEMERGFDKALLGRILFEADFLHFRRFGFPITGQTYRRGLTFPEPRALARACREMQSNGEIAITEIDLADGLHVKKTVRALRAPDLRLFDAGEIALVESIMRGKMMAAVKGEPWPDPLNIPWDLAAYREEIPYGLALVSLTSESWAAEPETLDRERMLSPNLEYSA